MHISGTKGSNGRSSRIANRLTIDRAIPAVPAVQLLGLNACEMQQIALTWTNIIKGAVAAF